MNQTQNGLYFHNFANWILEFAVSTIFATSISKFYKTRRHAQPYRIEWLFSSTFNGTVRCSALFLDLNQKYKNGDVYEFQGYKRKSSGTLKCSLFPSIRIHNLFDR